MLSVKELKELKKKLGYSNARLSDESKIPLGTINKIFSGVTENPRYDTLRVIEETLVAVDQIQIKMQKERLNRTVEEKYSFAPSESLLREEAVKYGVPLEKGPGDFTIDDYYALPDEHRLELIDGVFYDMAAPTIMHQKIVVSLIVSLSSYISEKGGSCSAFVAPVDVKIDVKDDKTILQPDVLVVCDPSKITEKRIEGAPDFIIEVVSPSSMAKDYYRKAFKYEESGVREYWVIDPQRKTVMVYYFEKKLPPLICPLAGELEVGIYDGDLKIDLGKLEL